MPLFVSIGAFIVNLCANYAFIFGKFGMPRMEVAGAALGTLIARLFEASVICGYLLFADKRIGFRCTPADEDQRFSRGVRTNQYTGSDQ